MSLPVIVLGAGIVGVSTALALQARGQVVVLVDCNPPGSETSYGNAGIIALSSLIPFNNARLFASLPAYLAKRYPGFRYDAGFVLRHADLMLRYLWHARPAEVPARIRALHNLIDQSGRLHPQWLQQAGQAQRLRNTGWLKLYRSEQGFAGSAYERAVLDEYAIRYRVLDKQQVQVMEPQLQPVFERGLWIEDISSVDSPAAVTRAYADLFVARGGTVREWRVETARQLGNGAWQLLGADGTTLDGQQLVLALGPWSKDFLAGLGVRLPMFFERGGHREYQLSAGQGIRHPIYDTAEGVVLTPMEAGLRMTCGVELNAQDAPYSPEQLDHAEQVARSLMEFGEQKGDDWMGCRPTLPDCVPVIGPTRQPGLWVNTGHQHIGFSTGPASGELLARLLVGEKGVEGGAYAPGRFGF